jgi:hypothetical protein
MRTTTTGSDRAACQGRSPTSSRSLRLHPVGVVGGLVVAIAFCPSSISPGRRSGLALHAILGQLAAEGPVLRVAPVVVAHPQGLLGPGKEDPRARASPPDVACGLRDHRRRAEGVDRHLSHLRLPSASSCCPGGGRARRIRSHSPAGAAALAPPAGPGGGRCFDLALPKALSLLLQDRIASSERPRIVPFLKAYVVDQYHWLGNRQFLDSVAIMIPGASSSRDVRWLSPEWASGRRRGLRGHLRSAVLSRSPTPLLLHASVNARLRIRPRHPRWRWSACSWARRSGGQDGDRRRPHDRARGRRVRPSVEGSPEPPSSLPVR